MSGLSQAKYSPMSANIRPRTMSDEENSQSLMNAKDDELTIGKIRSPKQLMQWFLKDPCKRWHIMFFLGIFLFSLILVIVSAVDPSSSYTLSGVAGVIVSLYATYYFRTLIALKEQVDQFERHNNSFKQENGKLRIELDKLKKTKDELEQTTVNLQDATKRSKDNLEKFEKMSKNMELMGQHNVDGMSRLAELTKKMAKKWSDELYQQERQLYMDVFEQLEMKDEDEDMTKDEYETFLDTLPPKYRMKLQHQKSFATLAGDDNKVSYKEFGDLLDKLAHEFATPNSPITNAENIAVAGHPSDM